MEFTAVIQVNGINLSLPYKACTKLSSNCHWVSATCIPNFNLSYSYAAESLSQTVCGTVQ